MGDLAEQVKVIQRSDPGAKQAWWDYCDTHLGGVKDPSRHEASVLQEFLNGYNSGAIQHATPQPQKGGGKGGSKGGAYTMGGGGGGGVGWGGGGFPMGGGMGMGGMGMGMSMGGGSDMGQFIKTGQRVSQSWKAAWQGYCMVNGTGKFDPAGYDSNFISGFIEYVGSLALNDMGGPPPMAMVGDKRAGVWGAPPAKRAAIMGGMGMGGGDPQLADLVSRVKSVQKSDLAGKEAWWSFCDTSLGGVKDPSRHDAATLQQFLTQYGA